MLQDVDLATGADVDDAGRGRGRGRGCSPNGATEVAAAVRAILAAPVVRDRRDRRRSFREMYVAAPVGGPGRRGLRRPARPHRRRAGDRRLQDRPRSDTDAALDARSRGLPAPARGVRRGRRGGDRGAGRAGRAGLRRGAGTRSRRSSGAFERVANSGVERAPGARWPPPALEARDPAVRSARKFRRAGVGSWSLPHALHAAVPPAPLDRRARRVHPRRVSRRARTRGVEDRRQRPVHGHGGAVRSARSRVRPRSTTPTAT